MRMTLAAALLAAPMITWAQCPPALDSTEMCQEGPAQIDAASIENLDSFSVTFANTSTAGSFCPDGKVWAYLDSNAGQAGYVSYMSEVHRERRLQAQADLFQIPMPHSAVATSDVLTWSFVTVSRNPSSGAAPVPTCIFNGAISTNANPGQQ